jgi:ribose 5-phosphate isomerase B
MQIFLASDHAGFELKEKVKKFLSDSGYAVEDCGAYTFDPNDDYPDFVHKAAEAVSKCETEKKNTGDLSRVCRGIILGGSGQGEAEEANRHENVRAAVYYGGPEQIVTLSREHNDSNILSLGARFLKEAEALTAVKLWLETPFSHEERHERRIDKID